jgi:hypothetical protein
VLKKLRKFFGIVEINCAVHCGNRLTVNQKKVNRKVQLYDPEYPEDHEPQQL